MHLAAVKIQHLHMLPYLITAYKIFLSYIKSLFVLIKSDANCFDFLVMQVVSRLGEFPKAERGTCDEQNEWNAKKRWITTER